MSAAAVEEQYPASPPIDLTAERAVLEDLLGHTPALYCIAGLIKPEDFVDRRYALILEAMLWLLEKSQPVDKVTVRQRLRRNDSPIEVGEVLDELQPQSEDIDRTRAHARVVRELAVRRRLISAARDIQGDALDYTRDLANVLDAAERRVVDAAEATRERGLQQVGVSVKAVFADLETRYENHEANPAPVKSRKQRHSDRMGLVETIMCIGLAVILVSMVGSIVLWRWGGHANVRNGRWWSRLAKARSWPLRSSHRGRLSAACSRPPAFRR